MTAGGFASVFLLLLSSTLDCCCRAGAAAAASAGSRSEIRGNSTFDCSPSGFCLRCSFSEKDDDEKYHCSTTGYRQAYKCVEAHREKQKDNSGQGKVAQSVGGKAADGNPDDLEGRESREGLTDEISGNEERGRISKATEDDDLHTYHMFLSCLSAVDDEKLSVFGFEGIVLGLLVISAPVMYIRKRRSYAGSGMTRGSNSRF